MIRFAAITAAVAILAIHAAAQIRGSTRVQDLAASKFLVARRDLPDPNFAGTVVLLTHYGEENGAAGLIVNRQMKIPLSRAIEDLKGAKDRTDPVYAGGPVARTGIMALVRSKTKLEDASHVLDDIYLILAKAGLERALGQGPEALRLYLGHSGWAPGQLEFEVELGTWHIFRGDADIVFDAKPETVWERLIRRTEMRLALKRL